MASIVSQGVFPKISKGTIEPLCTKLPLKFLAQFYHILYNVLTRFRGQ